MLNELRNFINNKNTRIMKIKTAKYQNITGRRQQFGFFAFKTSDVKRFLQIFADINNVTTDVISITIKNKLYQFNNDGSFTELTSPQSPFSLGGSLEVFDDYLLTADGCRLYTSKGIATTQNTAFVELYLG